MKCRFHGPSIVNRAYVLSKWASPPRVSLTNHHGHSSATYLHSTIPRRAALTHISGSGKTICSAISPISEMHIQMQRCDPRESWLHVSVGFAPSKCYSSRRDVRLVAHALIRLHLQCFSSRASRSIIPVQITTVESSR